MYPVCDTPLWPAGHLPLKGGDRLFSLPLPIAGVAEATPMRELQISPLEGEMAGRPEGGAARQATAHIRAGTYPG